MVGVCGDQYRDETPIHIDLLSRRGTDPPAAFLHRLTEQHDLSEAVLLVDGYGYLTGLSRLDLSGRLEYSLRYHIEKWLHALKMKTDRFHSSWVGSRSTV